MPEANSNLLELTDANFNSTLEAYKESLLIVDFWAVWCGPCQIMGPIIEETAEKFSSNQKIKFAKINIDENPETTERQLIMSIPTMKVFHNNTVIDEIIGAVPKDHLLAKIETALQKVKA